MKFIFACGIYELTWYRQTTKLSVTARSKFRNDTSVRHRWKIHRANRISSNFEQDVKQEKEVFQSKLFLFLTAFWEIPYLINDMKEHISFDQIFFISSNFLL